MTILGGAVEAVARDLARQQAADGEGATTMLTCQVSGARDDVDARAVARAVISSSLVKAAAHGRDPNWGRVAGAAGNARLGEARLLEDAGLGRADACARAGAPVALDPDTLRIAIAGHLVYDGPSGGRSPSTAPRCGRRWTRPRSSSASTSASAGSGEASAATSPAVRDRERGEHDVSGPRPEARRDDAADQRRCWPRWPPWPGVGRSRSSTAAAADDRGLDRRASPPLRGRPRGDRRPGPRGGRGRPAGRRHSGARAALRDLRVDAVGLSGCDGGLLVAERGVRPGPGRPVVGITRDLLDAILGAGQVPWSPRSPATRAASSATSRRRRGGRAGGGAGSPPAVLMTDVDGIRDGGGRRLATLGAAQAEALSPTARSPAGWCRKSARPAGIAAPGAEAVICDAAAPDALARALPIPRSAHDHDGRGRGRRGRLGTAR